VGVDGAPNALLAHSIQVDANRAKVGPIRGYIFTLSQLDLSMTGADDWFGRRGSSDDPGAAIPAK
jgi:hypothetical protein